MSFRVARTDRERDGVATIAFSGELDMASAKRAEQALADAESEDPTEIVLDLAELTFMDSTGLNLVVRADNRARASGRVLSIVSPPDRIRRLFRITMLEDRLRFLPGPPPVPETDGPGGEGSREPESGIGGAVATGGKGGKGGSGA